MLPVRPPYLFDSALVEARVASLPNVAKLVHVKKRQGLRSDAFPALQKTEREILRILGRAEGYPHLDALLNSLEFCLERGWRTHQLSAQHRGEFASLISDLATAEHSLLRDFDMASPVGERDDGPKPDLYLTDDQGSLIVEVFRPRELQHFHNFEDDVSRLLKETEHLLDFRVNINLELVSPFDACGRLIAPPNPVELDDALAAVAEELLERLARRLELLAPASEVRAEETFAAQNLRVVCDFSEVRESSEREPVRLVCVGKSFGGYDPVGMLRRLCAPIAEKAAKRQAGEKAEATRILLCDVSGAVVAAHLRESSRAGRFREALLSELEPSVKSNYDVIALCLHQGWGRGWSTAWMVAADDGDKAAVERFLGPFA